MHTSRKIRKMFKSKPVIEGAGVHLKRAIYGWTLFRINQSFQKDIFDVLS